MSNVELVGGEVAEGASWSAWDLADGEVVVAKAQVIRLKNGGFAYMSKVTPEGYALDHGGILHAARGVRDTVKDLATNIYMRGKKSWLAAQKKRGAA